MCPLIWLLLQNKVGFTQAAFDKLLISNKAFDAFSLSTYIKLIGLRTSNPLDTAGFFWNNILVLTLIPCNFILVSVEMWWWKLSILISIEKDAMFVFIEWKKRKGIGKFLAFEICDIILLSSLVKLLLTHLCKNWVILLINFIRISVTS